MTRFRPALRLPRIALWLAFLAALSHVGLGYASAQHHARMLASGSGVWAEVCTPFGVERVALFDVERDGQDDPPAAAAQMTECLVCAAASFAAPPPSAAPPPLPPLAYQASGSAFSTDEPATAFLTLHPPPRAPPLLS